MHGKDAFTALHIGTGNDHAAVKAAGTEQGRIQNVGPVRCGNQDHAFVGFEAVHFNKQLVECLLALIMSTAETRAAMAPHRVDFIYKDDARGVFLALFEQVANPRCADTDEHFHEIRSADREKRDVGFAGDCPCQKRFSGSRGANQQDAFGNASAKLLEFLWLFQEIDDFLQLLLGLFYTRNIFKCDLLLMRRQQPRPAFAERKRLVAAALHLAHEENPESDDEEKWSPGNQRRQPRALAWLLACDLDLFVAKQVDEFRIIHRYDSLEAVARGKLASDIRLGNDHFLDISTLDFLKELAKWENPVPRRRCLLHDLVKQDGRQQQRDPEQNRFCGRIQLKPPSLRFYSP